MLHLLFDKLRDYYELYFYTKVSDEMRKGRYVYYKILRMSNVS